MASRQRRRSTRPRSMARPLGPEQRRRSRAGLRILVLVAVIGLIALMLAGPTLFAIQATPTPPPSGVVSSFAP